MNPYISKKKRKLLMDMGISRQTIGNWISGRKKPSRVTRALLDIIDGKLKANGKRAA